MAHTAGLFLDVAPDNWVTPLDVLTLINDINVHDVHQVPGGEGEAWSVNSIGSALESRRLPIPAASLSAAEGEAPLADVESGPGYSDRSGAASGSWNALVSARAGQPPRADEPVRGGGEHSRTAARMQRLPGPATARAVDESLVLGGDLEDSLSDFVGEVAELWRSGG